MTGQHAGQTLGAVDIVGQYGRISETTADSVNVHLSLTDRSIRE